MCRPVCRSLLFIPIFVFGAALTCAEQVGYFHAHTEGAYQLQIAYYNLPDADLLQQLHNSGGLVTLLHGIYSDSSTGLQRNDSYIYMRCPKTKYPRFHYRSYRPRSPGEAIKVNTREGPAFAGPVDLVLLEGALVFWIRSSIE